MSFDLEMCGMDKMDSRKFYKSYLNFVLYYSVETDMGMGSSTHERTRRLE